MTSEEKRRYHREYYRQHYKGYYKEVYHWRKEHKMCVSCGHEKAEPGKIYCLECKEKRHRYYQDMPEEKKLKIAELNKARYEERKKNGLCVRCGKPCMRGKVGSSPSGKKKCIYCKEHYDMMTEYYKEKRRRNKLQKGEQNG